MPVILEKEDYAAWLDPMPQAKDSDKLLSLIRPFPADRMAAYPVSTLVNTPSNDRMELTAPAIN